MRRPTGRISSQNGDLQPWRSIPSLAAALLLASCGGGSGAGSGGGTAAPPLATGLLEVTVTDPFGTPVPGADVVFCPDEESCWAGSSAITDADGRASLRAKSTQGLLQVSHDVLGNSDPLTIKVPQGGRVELRQSIRAWVSSNPLAIASAQVEADGLSDDGRLLRLRLDVYRAPDPENTDADYSRLVDQASLLDCVARSGDALSALGPRCVDRGDASDSSWRAVEEGALPAPAADIATQQAPAVLLMLDRSEVAVSRDVSERRLYSAKALASALMPAAQIAVAAFAGDGGPAGTASPLAEVPVTFVGDQATPFFAASGEAITAIESLRGLVGGSAPLHASIAAGLEFLVGRAEVGRPRALVLLTDGRDDACVTIDACAPLSRDVARRAEELGVTVYVITPGQGWDGDQGRDVLLELDRADGFVRVMEPVYWDFMGAVEIVRSAIQGGQVLRSVGFTIEGESAGRFQSGDVVSGVLEVWVAGGMNPQNETLGFSLRVP